VIICYRLGHGCRTSYIIQGQSNITHYHHVKIESPFKATLPDNNILGLPVSPGIMTKDINIVSNGHWIWLNPLPIGEHRLHLYGYSSHYAAELNATLSIAGSRVP
jgi:hypothetical protein